MSQSLGNRVATYRPNALKPVINIFLAAGLALIGFLVMSMSDKSAGFVMSGIALIIIGLLVAGRMFFQLRSGVTLYEYGLDARGRQWRYTDLTDVIENVGRLNYRGIEGPRVEQGTSFFQGDMPAFMLMSDLSNWKAASADLKERVITANLATLLDRVQRGEVIEFKRLVNGYYLSPTPFPLAVAKEGLLLPDQTFIGWPLIRKLRLGSDRWSTITAEIVLEGDKVLAFNLENSREGILAHTLIQKLVTEHT
jgi:hypothetical protein